MIRVLIDENLSEYLAEGLDMLQQPNGDGIEVVSILKEFYRGIKDEEWIPVWGQKDGIFITQDIRISKKKSQVELLLKHRLGAFFLNVPNNYRYWNKVEIIVQRWAEIVAVIKKTQRPFAFEITPRGKLRPLSL